MSSRTRQLRENLSDDLYGDGITIGSLGSDPEVDSYIQEKFEAVDWNVEWEKRELLKESTESDKMDFVFNQVRGIDSASK